MKKTLLLAALVAALASPAQARHRHHHHKTIAYSDARPRAWCGWWMRHHLGVSNPAGNLARWWAGYGSRAFGPAVGVIVVWAHHVGIITGHDGKNWVVKSGNDGHAVRERPRRLNGVIAYRQA